ncbi:5-oxoprolinase subunit PxpB [Marinobacterium mangrovicola]|uniref:KipI family sensor histidine kinase inhibitor n=1 Tax=Marinobacterium mangrovicola TaxID=1476959 RepID=A0A4R1GN04_9GAMM|nr:5-oxoprolinase subunit PxpB [Marinobacterium mangrovicola]TCK08573.1 KipI family sensor histidine kinase inhibitor [Marinobacterium mangrovicola]
MRIEIAGENALILYFGEETDPRVSAQVQRAVAETEARLGSAVIDLVPSYASLLVIYDPLQLDHLQVKRLLSDLGNSDEDEEVSEGSLIKLPVWYSSESGPDLDALAERAGMSVSDVIDLHASTEYRVYAIGFAPGFAYLGQVDERIAAPRLSTPRQVVPRGSVAIADRQTAIYPAASPGGWNLIGRCPTRMFNPEADPCMPVQVGDRVSFEPIDKERYLELGGEL